MEAYWLVYPTVCDPLGLPLAPGLKNVQNTQIQPRVLLLMYTVLQPVYLTSVANIKIHPGCYSMCSTI